MSSRTLQGTPGAFTDKNKAYNSLDNHETVNHGDGEYVRGRVRINGAEPFLAPVGRGYSGTFRRIEPKHLHRYVNEFAGRLGMRALGTVGKMRTIVQNLVGKRLTYEQLVAPSVLCGRP